MPEELCHCGKPLHYQDPKMETYIRDLVDELGPLVQVTSPEGIWLVPRHYIALHGLKAVDLPNLGFQKL